ncbi:MAG: hypothetical protein JRJ12_02910 [Deltaproteobacteria bacterium]|nr:hypothetical protein [Deltaproteobacteria bacterium]MBW2070131.1 hypothetical protein [Deltaproteobacteria bacterium]
MLTVNGIGGSCAADAVLPEQDASQSRLAEATFTIVRARVKAATTDSMSSLARIAGSHLSDRNYS